MPTPEWYAENKYSWWKLTIIYLVIALFVFQLVGKAVRADQAMRCDAENGNFNNGTWECEVK